MKFDVIIYLLFVTGFTTSNNAYESREMKPVLGFNKFKYILAGQTFNTSCTVPPVCFNETYLCNINLLHIVHCVGTSQCAGVIQNTSTTSNTTINFSKSDLVPGDTGTYLCRYNHTTQDSFNLFIVDKPTGPVNINCISNDLVDLNCSWMKSKKDHDSRLVVQYRSYFHSSPMYGEFDCPHPKPTQESHRDDRSCYIASSTKQENYTFVMMNSYTLYINASNLAGSYLSKYPVNLTRIVKLSPPNVSSKIDARNVTLTLKQKFYEPLFLIKSVIYEISYHIQGKKKTVIFHSSKRSSEVPISDLIPYSRYTITIRNRSPTKQVVYWSDISTLHCKTLPSAPVAVPEIYGYTIHKGIISIYIKPILAIDKYSENASYNISIRRSDIPLLELAASWDTTLLYNVSVPTKCNQEVEIRTINDIAASNESSRIDIPGYIKDRPIPTNVIVEGLTNEFYVSWDTRGDIRNLNKTVVLWCVGKDYNCKSDLNSTEISSDVLSTRIQTVRDGPWIFAVYFVYNDGYMTEMVFTECQFQSLNQEPRGVAVFSVVSQTKQLLVKPGDFCSTKYPSRPLEYIVLYKQKTDQKVTVCDETFRNISIRATPDQQDIILHNLKKSTNYVICLSVVTRGGNRAISEPLMSTTLSSKNSNDNSWVTAVAVFVCCCVAVTIVMLVGSKLRKRWKEIDTEIELPKINVKYLKISMYDSEKILKEKLFDSGLPSSRSSDEISSNTSEQYKVKIDNIKEGTTSSTCSEIISGRNLQRRDHSELSNRSQDTEFPSDDVGRTDSDHDISTSDLSDSYTDVSQEFDDDDSSGVSDNKNFEIDLEQSLTHCLQNTNCKQISDEEQVNKHGLENDLAKHHHHKDTCLCRIQKGGSRPSFTGSSVSNNSNFSSTKTCSVDTQSIDKTQAIDHQKDISDISNYAKVTNIISSNSEC